MPDPSPKSARGATFTALGNRMLAGGDPDDDPSLTYPHYRRGIPKVAAKEGTTSDFARQVDALVAWLGESKPVTATGVLKPAVAREAYAALRLHDWQRAYDAVVDPLDGVKDMRWESDVAGFRARYEGMDNPELHRVARALSDQPVDQSVAFFDDAGLWHRKGKILRLTDFGREATVVLMNMLDDGLLDDDEW